MDYFAIKSGNTLLEKGELPNIMNTNKGVSAGFGRFNPINEEFEFPLDVQETENGNYVIKAWDINETPIVYECLQKNGSKQTIHCNLTELQFKVAPFLHLFCFHRINEKIQDKKVFHFIDDESGARLFICHKEEYKSFYG